MGTFLLSLKKQPLRIIYTVIIKNIQPICEDSYIGETKRQLQTRIREHNQPSKKQPLRIIYTVIIKNIQPCPKFKEELTTNYGGQPNPDQKYTFIKNCFTVLQSNLTNTRGRKTYEAVAITIDRPKLNAQTKCPSFSSQGFYYITLSEDGP